MYISTNNINTSPKITHRLICNTLEYAANPLPSITLIITTALINTNNPTIIIKLKFQQYKIPNFKTAPANTIDPTIDASACTFGNHICNLYNGNFAKPNITKINLITTILLFITTLNPSTNLKNIMNILALPRS